MEAICPIRAIVRPSAIEVVLHVLEKTASAAIAVTCSDERFPCLLHPYYHLVSIGLPRACGAVFTACWLLPFSSRESLEVDGRNFCRQVGCAAHGEKSELRVAPGYCCTKDVSTWRRSLGECNTSAGAPSGCGRCVSRPRKESYLLGRFVVCSRVSCRGLRFLELFGPPRAHTHTVCLHSRVSQCSRR